MNDPVLDKIAYSIPNFAKAVDLSVEKVRQHIARGELVPSYVDAKPLIMREEGDAIPFYCPVNEIMRELTYRSAAAPQPHRSHHPPGSGKTHSRHRYSSCSGRKPRTA